MLVQHDCTALPVVEHDDSREPIGIVTGLSITARMMTDAQMPGLLQALDVMTTPLKVAPDMTVADAHALLDESLVRNLVVIDPKGNCIGMVSKSALIRHRERSNHYPSRYA
jgi:CBS domain-containing protein